MQIEAWAILIAVKLEIPGNACIIPSVFMTRGSLLPKLIGGAQV